MIPPKERESFSAINSKVNSIEQYLAAVDRDMNALAEEQDLWREEKREWEDAGVRMIDQAESKIKAELNNIEKEIIKRDERCREAVEKINIRIRAIQEIQFQCGSLIGQLHRRLGAIEEVLGGN